jgi:hypothetical protein
LVRKFAHDAFVLRVGFVGFALFAIDFTDAEDSCGGEFAVFVEAVDDALLRFDCGGEVVVGFFFEEAFLEGGGQVVRGGEAGVSEHEYRKNSQEGSLPYGSRNAQCTGFQTP